MATTLGELLAQLKPNHPTNERLYPIMDWFTDTLPELTLPTENAFYDALFGTSAVVLVYIVSILFWTWILRDKLKSPPVGKEKGLYGLLYDFAIMGSMALAPLYAGVSLVIYGVILIWAGMIWPFLQLLHEKWKQFEQNGDAALGTHFRQEEHTPMLIDDPTAIYT